MASAGEVTTRQTASGAVAVVGAAATLARPTAWVAVVTTFALVTLTTVRIGHAVTLAAQQVTEHVARTQTVALAHCTRTRTNTPVPT